MEPRQLKNQPGLVQRVSELEEQGRVQQETLNGHHDKHLRDLRFLAEQLGVVLPSDQEVPAPAYRDGVGASDDWRRGR